MTKLVATVPTTYDVNFILDKDGKPLINLEDFCQVLDFTFADSFDFFDSFGERMKSIWPEVGSYVERDGIWYITVPQAYALLPQADGYDRIWTAACLLEHTLTKALNQGDLD